MWWNEVPSTPGIYRIVNMSNGHVYIGSAKNLLQRERIEFKDLVIGNHKNPHLQSEYDLYGADVFRFGVLECVEQVESLLSRKQYFIDTLIPNYNMRSSCDIPTQKFCPGCKQLRSVDLFGKQRASKDGLRRICKSCRRDEYLAGREDILQHNYDRYHALSSNERREFLDLQNKYRNNRSVRERQAGMCSKCIAQPAEMGALCKRCYKYQEQYISYLRAQVMSVYGGSCVVCGETHPAFLAIDHVNDDGAEQRRSTGNGQRFYLWLRKNNFPDGYQVLCHNHNWLKYLNTLSKKQTSNKQTSNRIQHDNLRREILRAYGNVCVCCGEERQEVLTIDHIDGGGNDHRRSIGHLAGSSFYRWLRKQKFPEGFQLLCFNCNRAKYYYIACPHQVESSNVIE